MRRIVAGAACLLALALPSRAQEWTRFRGPNGTGISASKTAPVTWTEKDYLWRVKLPGEGDGQPVIWGDKIFLTCCQGDGAQRLLVCLRKDNGQEVWSKKFAMSAYNRGKSRTHASSSPAVDKDRVVACFADPQQYFVKAWDHSGKELWTANLGPFQSQHGQGSSPVLFEDRVIVTNDQDGPSFVTALDAKTGRTIWRTPRKPAPEGTAYGTPTVLLREGSPPELLLTSKSHGISCLDLRTGTPKWEAVVFDKRAVASPVVCGDLVIGSCGAGGGRADYVSAVKLGGKGDVTSSHAAWTIKQAAPYVPTPLVIGNRIFLLDDIGIASWVEGPTGRVLWSERVGGNFYASPVLVGGKIYCSSTEGQTVVLEAADEYKVVAKNPLGEGSMATPCVDGGRLYLRTYTHLLCVGPK